MSTTYKFNTFSDLEKKLQQILAELSTNLFQGFLLDNIAFKCSQEHVYKYLCDVLLSKSQFQFQFRINHRYASYFKLKKAVKTALGNFEYFLLDQLTTSSINNEGVFSSIEIFHPNKSFTEAATLLQSRDVGSGEIVVSDGRKIFSYIIELSDKTWLEIRLVNQSMVGKIIHNDIKISSSMIL